MRNTRYIPLRNNITFFTLNLFFWLLVCSVPCLAYDDDVTHPEITKKAIKKSENLDNARKDLKITNKTFSFRSGLISKKGKEYDQLLTEGSTDEDNKDYFLRHFYDPISGDGWGVYESAYNRGANGAGTPWGYTDAVGYFYSALTSTTKESKNANFGKMFYSLGRTVHLLQDMSVPAHVRDDPHFPYFNQLLGEKDMYEAHVETLGSNLPSGNAVDFGDRHFYWDDESGNGLAEYTNRHFFSKGTIFENYTYPHEDEGGWKLVSKTAEDGKVDIVKYLYTDEVSPLAKFTVFYKFGLHISGLERVSYHLDNECHNAYAKLLIPRAVGYSAGLLDHFFRGEISYV
ncbi:hypothetical protein KKC91_03935 [bacterium]|nr:hypothetical protein [bacterium]